MRFLFFILVFLIFFSFSVFAIGISPNKLEFNDSVKTRSITLFNTDNVDVDYEIISDKNLIINSKKGIIPSDSNKKITIKTKKRTNAKTAIEILFKKDTIASGIEIPVKIKTQKRKFIGIIISLITIIAGLAVYRLIRTISYS